MAKHWTSARHDRPRCKATDAHGLRCCNPVVWDDLTDRPLSTRCQGHGGLDDAALMVRRLHDPLDAKRSATEARSAVVDAMNDPPAMGLGRHLPGLLTLALAVVLCLSMAGPALADYESAVAAYERGAYQEAQSQFEALAAAGDRRAVRYLQRIHQERTVATQSEETIVSIVIDTVSSIFGVSDGPSIEPRSTSSTGDTRYSASDPGSAAASAGKPADQERWMPFEQSTARPVPALPAESNIIVPYRQSIWSRIFHLPGDATAIGLQHVARFLSAENLSRELQSISRHSDKIALSILAGFWWLVIVRGLVALGVGVSRFMRAATTMREPKHYG